MGECASRIPPSELIPGEIRVAQAAWRVFLVHDAPINSGMRRAQPVRDNLHCRDSASYSALHRRFPYREEPGERVELEWL